MNNIKFDNKPILVFSLSVIFILLAVPFKVMNLLPGFTEIRPVDSLNMLYGLMFGIYGALACALGNLVADILGGTFMISSWAGFASNFIGTYIAYIIWYGIAKKQPHINNIKQVIIFILDSVIVAVIIAIIVALGVWISYDNIEGFTIFAQVFLNTVFFSVVLAMPMIIVLNVEYGIKGIVPKKYS